MTHDKVWSAFARSADQPVAAIGVRGNRLKLIRMAADYHITRPWNLAEKVTEVLAEARDLMTEIQRLP